MENETIVIDFCKLILENQKDIEPEFVDIINDYFWELLTD
jgi:hypothetical protein